MRVSLKAVFSDAVEEFSMIHEAAACGATVLQTMPSEEEPSGEMNSDALIKELNKIFFETLIRFERCRREDYIAMPDGSFRKLSEDESVLRTFLEEIEKIIDIFQILEREIDKFGTFKTLEMHCNNKQAIVDMPIQLAKSLMDRDQLIKFLLEKTHQTEINFEKQRRFYDELIKKMKHEWQEARQLAKMSCKYLQESFKQRTELYDTIMEEETRALIDESQTYRQYTKAKKRLCYESSSCLYAEMDSHANRIKYLQGRTDVEEMKIKLEDLVSALSKARKDHEELRQEYRQCEEVVLDHRAAEDRKKLEEDRNQKMLVAIFQVQAWWRAMIVIRGIKVKSRGKIKRKARITSEGQ